MDLAPIKSTRIYEEIVRQVKAMIAEGRLKGGDRLPPERDLAEKFMVSRTSVREALRALRDERVDQLGRHAGVAEAADHDRCAVRNVGQGSFGSGEELVDHGRIIADAISALILTTHF